MVKRMEQEDLNKEKFKDLLLHAYKLGTESENMKVSNLIEEIKQQLVVSNRK